MGRGQPYRRAGAAALIALAAGALLAALAPAAGRPAVAGPNLSGALTREADVQRSIRRVPAPPQPHEVAIVPPGRPAVRVPILMYHYIRVNPDPADRLGFNLSVTPADFAG